VICALAEKEKFPVACVRKRSSARNTQKYVFLLNRDADKKIYRRNKRLSGKIRLTYFLRKHYFEVENQIAVIKYSAKLL